MLGMLGKYINSRSKWPTLANHFLIKGSVRDCKNSVSCQKWLLFINAIWMYKEKKNDVVKVESNSTFGNDVTANKSEELICFPLTS